VHSKAKSGLSLTHSYSLSSHECAPGAQAAKQRGPKVEVRQASTCKSPRAAEHTWRRPLLAVTGTHSSWRYSQSTRLTDRRTDGRTDRILIASSK